MSLLKNLKYIAVAMALFVGGLGTPIMAHADGTPEEAKEMTLAAAQYVRDHGIEAASAKFNEAESEFIKDDLYVFAMDEKGVFLAHPIKPVFVGRDMSDLTDVEGTKIIMEMLKVEGEGWVEYKWSHPGTKKVKPKKTYVVNLDGYYIGVGAYSDE